VPFRKIFLSRWAALLWAAGILWTAFDTVGFGPPAAHDKPEAASNESDATELNVNNDDLAILANAMRSD
jgi:hypothetical protein